MRPLTPAIWQVDKDKDGNVTKKNLFGVMVSWLGWNKLTPVRAPHGPRQAVVQRVDCV